MAKAFYSEYVKHCLRFYARHADPVFRNDIDRYNWNACESALRLYSGKERGLLLEVYRGTDTIPDNIYRVSTMANVPQDTLWKLITELEREVAKRRGLL